MNLGAGGLGRLIRRDMSQLTRGRQLNSCDVWVFWHAAVHTFTHEQTVPAASWTAFHGMGERPMLAVLDSAGEVVAAKVEHLSLREVRVTVTSAISGTLICLRPGLCHKQTEAASTWTITHALGGTPLAQVVVDGEIVSADVFWINDTTVQVDFSEAASGYALLAAPTHTFEQVLAITPWTVAHNLGRRPLVQIIDGESESVIGPIVHNSANAFTFTPAAETAGKAIAVHVGTETTTEFNPNVQATYPSTTLQSGSWPGFAHFVQPSSTGFRVNTKMKEGDCVVDFMHDVPLPAEGYFEIDGRRYSQKKLGEEIPESWDVVVGGERMMRTVVLSLQK